MRSFVSNRKSPTYRQSILTFIDILGFREIIKHYSAEKILEIVKKTQKYGGAADEADLIKFELNKKITHTRCVFFSDSIVRVHPINQMSPAKSLFSEILDLLHAQASLADEGILIRGALTVGEIHLEDNVIFGPAMVRAYDLESKEAVYPRIIIDPASLSEFEQDDKRRAQDAGVPGDWKYIEKLLRKCPDDYFAINYLGSIRDELDHYDQFPRYLAKIRDMILVQGKSTEKNARVLEKYIWMADYLNETASKYPDCRGQDILIGEKEILRMRRRCQILSAPTPRLDPSPPA